MVSFRSLYQTQVTESGVIFDGLTEEKVASTASIADGASDDIDVVINRAYLLCCIETDVDALVRVYGSSAGRTADARAAGVPPTGTEESLIAEVDTTGGNLRIDLSPSVVAVNSENPQQELAYLRVFNQSGGPSVVNTTLTTSTVGSAVSTSSMSRAEVLRVASFGIPSPTPPIPIIWDAAPIDSGGMTDIGGAMPEKITIVQDGRYVINGTVQTDIPSYAGTGATETVVLIALNGTTFIAGIKQLLTTSNPIINVTAEADLVAGDFLTLDIAHDGGAAGPVFTTPIAPPNDFPKFSVMQIPSVSGAASGGKVRALVGDGVAQTFVVTHNFNTRDCFVVVYRNSAPYEEILVDVQHTSVNAITLDFTPSTPAVNEFVAVIGLGTAGGGGGGSGAPGEVTTAVTSTGSNIVVTETDPEYHFITPSANITFSVPMTPTLDRRYVVKHEGGANTIDVDDGTTSFTILNGGQDVAVIFSTVDNIWRIE